MSGMHAQTTPVFPTQPTIGQGAPLTNLPVTFPSHHYGVGVQPQPPPFPPATRTNPFSASGQGWEVESQPVVGGTPSQTQSQATLTGTARSIAGPVSTGSRASGSAPHSGHSHRPQCKVPGCQNSAYFDNTINEQRYYCETHIRTVVRDGFAAPCRRCQQMPAHDNSEFCSRSCSNAGARGQQVVYQQPTMTQPAPTLCEECRSSQAKLGKRFCGGTCANNHNARRQREGSSVYDSFKPTCQECRRPMEHNGRFCSRECERANSRSSER
ncbi:hypothetical protein BJV78DRAFT_215487 [Lactifluus subvellereus]|nr:hypothetical protein BJV78DRAFT_215487 [Lactifluus subvellereus]